MVDYSPNNTIPGLRFIVMPISVVAPSYRHSWRLTTPHGVYMARERLHTWGVHHVALTRAAAFLAPSPRGLQRD